VNSVKARLPRLLEWLDEAKPDIVCLQEIKTTTALFPEAEVNELGDYMNVDAISYQPVFTLRGNPCWPS